MSIPLPFFFVTFYGASTTSFLKATARLPPFSGSNRDQAWQAVHEPMDAPASYLVPYESIEDPSRKIYAGMLSVLDEGIGNITRTLKANGMYENSVMVLSNDNGGMSGTYVIR